MVICRDFFESESSEKNNSETNSDLKCIEWKFPEGVKLPVEILSVYSIEQGHVVIRDIDDEVMKAIKKSKYSRVSGHYIVREELFIIYFEFAVELGKNEFDVYHFGIAPAQDFFNTIEDNKKIILRDEIFVLTEYRINRILNKKQEFENKLQEV